jgi:hypothetical protein
MGHDYDNKNRMDSGHCSSWGRGQTREQICGGGRSDWGGEKVRENLGEMSGQSSLVVMFSVVCANFLVSA